MSSGESLLASLWEWPFRAQNTLHVQGWGFWLAIIGLMLTLIGFGITWAQLIKTQKAADAVRLEVKRIEVSVQSYDAAHHVSKAASALDATKRHLRNCAWSDVADSYEDFRRSVITLKEMNIPSLQSFDVAIDEANLYISRLCERIEVQVLKSNVTIDAAKTVTMIRKHGELTGSIDAVLQRELVS